MLTRSGYTPTITDNETQREGLELIREGLLKYCIMYTTGPYILKNLFDRSVMSSDEIEKDVSRYTYENNNLFYCFSSGNAIKLHSPLSITKMQGKLGETNDASWLHSGEEHIKLREENLHKKAYVIQKKFKKIMQNRETEKSDIERVNPPKNN